MTLPLGQCGGCGGLLFAHVFHVCSSNMHLYQGTIPKEELEKLIAGSYVPPPPQANDSGVISEPPQLTHKQGRTHCEACKEPVDPSVMHKCHGNQEYQPPQISSTEITEPCPECGGSGVRGGVLHMTARGDVVVCATCRTYLYPEVKNRAVAISSWNHDAAKGGKGMWPVWRALLPGESEMAGSVESNIGKDGQLK